MLGKAFRAARVPIHPRLGVSFRPSVATGSERKITSPNTCVSSVSMMSAMAKRGSPPVVAEGVVHGRDLPGFILRIRRDDGNLPAGSAEVIRNRASGGTICASRAPRRSVPEQSPACLARHPSVRGPTPARGRFDRLARPGFDFAHMGGLGKIDACTGASSRVPRMKAVRRPGPWHTMRRRFPSLWMANFNK
jgi:hypothetical protein